MTGESRKGEGDMWTTACRKRIHRFIDSTAAYIYIYYTNVVFLLFRICVNKLIVKFKTLESLRIADHFTLNKREQILKVIF